jgi:hypothetical protein
MSWSRFSVLKSYPPIVEQLLAALGLTATDIYRDGPRYWVGRVSRDDQDLILKVVIDDSPWVDAETQVVYRPSDQLKTEISVSAGLEQYADEITGNVPCVQASSSEGEIWILRELQKGQDMGRSKSPLLFRPEFFTDSMTTSLIDYVISYQALSSKLQPLLPPPPYAGQSSVAAKMKAIDLDNPTELLEPYAPAIRDYLVRYSALHDQHRNTISHGQVFPPHIYRQGDKVGFIDWENAGMYNHLQDFVSVWIRSFQQQDWREGYLNQLTERGILATPDDHILWRMETLLQSGGNLNYLFWSKNEEPADQAELIVSFRRQIEEVLAKTV